ncbi:hypothetical protein QCA50_013049 [Cerrena zonata]|uniref:Uncharacterized protein n=1 Tax=Cerrena zonata TaxID=2478898 RepID=A0AAW0G180_9APHY
MLLVALHKPLIIIPRTTKESALLCIYQTLRHKYILYDSQKISFKFSLTHPSSSCQHLVRNVSSHRQNTCSTLHSLPNNRLNARHLLHTKVDESVTIGGTSYRSDVNPRLSARELQKVQANTVTPNRHVHVQITKDTKVTMDSEKASSKDGSMMVFKPSNSDE